MRFYHYVFRDSDKYTWTLLYWKKKQLDVEEWILLLFYMFSYKNKTTKIEKNVRISDYHIDYYVRHCQWTNSRLHLFDQW